MNIALCVYVCVHRIVSLLDSDYFIRLVSHSPATSFLSCAVAGIFIRNHTLIQYMHSMLQKLMRRQCDPSRRSFSLHPPAHPPFPRIQLLFANKLHSIHNVHVCMIVSHTLTALLLRAEVAAAAVAVVCSCWCGMDFRRSVVAVAVFVLLPSDRGHSIDKYTYTQQTCCVASVGGGGSQPMIPIRMHEPRACSMFTYCV